MRHHLRFQLNVRSIHNRMPVMLSSNEYDAWLDPQSEAECLRRLLEPREYRELTARQVSRSVNRAGNDGPQLISPVASNPPHLL